MNKPERIDALPLIPADVQARIAGTLIEDPYRLTESPEEREERHQRAERFRFDLWDRRVPLRFQTATTSQLDAAVAVAVSAFLTTDEARTLVLFSETPGVGKTHAAFAACNHAVHDLGMTGAAWAMADFNDAIRPGADSTAYDLARSVDILLLDDLGREKVSEWTLERLQGVLDARWRDCRKTVLTTNLPGEDFQDHYGDPIVDRIRDGMIRYTMTGQSRRKPAPW